MVWYIKKVSRNVDLLLQNSDRQKNERKNNSGGTIFYMSVDGFIFLRHMYFWGTMKMLSSCELGPVVCGPSMTIQSTVTCTGVRQNKDRDFYLFIYLLVYSSRYQHHLQSLSLLKPFLCSDGPKGLIGSFPKYSMSKENNLAAQKPLSLNV